jgi:PncC family amidohydrolase
MSGPEEILGEVLRKKGKTLSSAESCTGGRIADKITNVPGASDYFLGGAVTYSNDAKIELLGVKKESLDSFGAVSEQVAKEMAMGCRNAFCADIAVSTTGIAGPTGGTKEKPVGLVWFAVSDGRTTKAERKVFDGDRIQIKEKASLRAIDLVLNFLEGV